MANSKISVIIIKNRKRLVTLNNVVPASDSLEDIKRRIQQKTDVAMIKNANSGLLLFFNKKILDDDNKTLESYGILDATEILDLESFRVYAKHVEWNPGQYIVIDHDISPNSRIPDVKKILNAKTDIPIHEQRLVKHQEGQPEDKKIVLEETDAAGNQKTLADYGINRDDTLIIVDDISITLRHAPTKKILFQLDYCYPKDTIKSLKKRIQQECHILVDEQKLSYNGQELEEEKLEKLDDADQDSGHEAQKVPTIIRDYKIHHNAILDLDNEFHSMEIQIRLPTMEVFTISNINPLVDTLDYIKKKVQEIQNIPSARQFLDFMGNSLPDGTKTLMDCNIVKHGDIIDLTPHREKLTPVAEMTIFIKQQKDDELICELKVHPKDTISDVKKFIQDKTHILMILQKLSLSNGTELKDDRPTLHYCNVKNNDTIYLIKLPMEIKIRVINLDEQKKCLTLKAKASEEDGKNVFILSDMKRLDDTIEDVQSKIEQVIGIPIRKQYNLSYKGKDLVRGGELVDSTQEEDSNDTKFVKKPKTTLFDWYIKHNDMLDLTLAKEEVKPKKKEKAPVDPPKDGRPKNLKYEKNPVSWYGGTLNKGEPEDIIGLSFEKDESDGFFYVMKVDGIAERFTQVQKYDRLLKFQGKDANVNDGHYSSVEELNQIMIDSMRITFETIHPEVDRSLDESGEDEDDGVEKGDVIPLTNFDTDPALNGFRVELMKKAKNGKWMVKVLKTGKVMLVDRHNLE